MELLTDKKTAVSGGALAALEMWATGGTSSGGGASSAAAEPAQPPATQLTGFTGIVRGARGANSIGVPHVVFSGAYAGDGYSTSAAAFLTHAPARRTRRRLKRRC